MVLSVHHTYYMYTRRSCMNKPYTQNVEHVHNNLLYLVIIIYT